MRLFLSLSLLLVMLVTVLNVAVAFAPHVARGAPSGRTSFLYAASTEIAAKQEVETSVAELKKVLQREYVSFFDPFERDYYQRDVTFVDPLATLQGLDAYQNNVDMLSSRTLLGSLLFSDANINLHSISGGEVSTNGQGETEISDITTRWTLRFCFKILPWKPTARFSGISVYRVAAPKSPGKKVQIIQQDDFWDAINLQQGGIYRAQDRSVGLRCFLNELKPNSDLNAPSAAPELPYELLRRGRDYDVRRYPTFTAAQLAYERRDEGFSALGSFAQGLNPLAPAILRVKETDKSKTMMWPLTFAAPGRDTPDQPAKASSGGVNVITEPSRVVAVGSFSDASVEPVVRKAARDLRLACQRDGLVLGDDDDDDAELEFCQYDAIFSMGKRRGEVWIPLPEGTHPWSQ